MTNKPEVAMTLLGGEQLVRLSDYEELQAVHEEELFCVRQTRDTHFGELMRALEQVDELKAECEKLRQQVETFQGLKPAMPPRPPTGEGLPRYGLRWDGPSQPLSVPMDDGYWTPWHLAQGECEKLRKEAVVLMAALEGIKVAATHKSIRTGIQAGTALGLIAALCDFALAARRKQGGES